MLWKEAGLQIPMSNAGGPRSKLAARHQRHHGGGAAGAGRRRRRRGPRHQGATTSCGSTYSPAALCMCSDAAPLLQQQLGPFLWTISLQLPPASVPAPALLATLHRACSLRALPSVIAPRSFLSLSGLTVPAAVVAAPMHPLTTLEPSKAVQEGHYAESFAS